MRVFAGIMIAAFGIISATPAAAQTFQAPGQIQFVAADSATSQPPRQNSTPIELRGQLGGVFCCGETGFIVGGGVGARPFNNRQVEITGDFSFLRFGGSNGVYVSGNGLYHFNTSEPNFKPFAGAGIGIVNWFDSTEARFQIVGGVELQSSGKHPIRPEIRFVFTEGDTTTILMVSVGLGKR